MSNVKTVQAIYEAFGKGDVPGILAHLAEDVRWEDWSGQNSAQNAGVPYLAARRGRAEVPAFFGAVAGNLEFREFNVLKIMDGGDQVAVSIRLHALVRSTQKELKDEEIHLWFFDAAGKVSAFRHYIDTAKHIEALRPR